MRIWKKPTFVQALILWCAGVAGGVAVLPYAFDLQGDAIAARLSAGWKISTLVALGVVQTAVLMAIAVAVGLRAARSLGLRAPVSEALSQGAPALGIVRSFARPAVGFGFLAGALTWILDSLVFLPAMPELREMGRAMLERHRTWKAALSTIYGGVTEEIMARLFVMGLAALALRAIVRDRSSPPRPAVMWAAILISAILFGLGHLPATAAVVPLSGLVVARALLLNGAVAIPCGWLYWKHGLEAAMLAHWVADVILHVIAPALALAGVLTL